MIKNIIAFLSLLFVAGRASANVADTNYVETAVSKTVSIEESANQTLQGRYTITGTLEVETPKLPDALN